MTERFLRRLTALALAGCCTVFASSCSLFRAPRLSDPTLGTQVATPAHLVQLGFGRRARFAQCVPPACPTRTPKTLASEAPRPRIYHADSATSAESVARATVAPAAATKPTVSRTVTIQFGVGSAKLSPTARSQLNGAMGNFLPARSITIIGRTDRTGPSAFNESLALARAIAVRDHLRKIHPTLAATLTLQARGTCCFVAANDTLAGRAQNRRAEVVFPMTEKALP